MIEIRQATRDDIDVLVPLFEAYREFYRQASATAAARRFLLERIEEGESVIFLAFQENVAIGFTQLYPSFSSVSMARIFILNDLFVAPQARRQGAAPALLDASVDYARRLGAVRLVLSTEVTNTTAQHLYEKRGWQRDTRFYVYQLPCAAA
jgi:GNAT superfamily N-acetyltransferase